MNFELNNEQKGLLEVTASNAAIDASRSFSKWLKTGVAIKMEKVEIVDFEVILNQQQSKAEESIGLCMRLEQGILGDLLFLFTLDTAKNLADILLKRPMGETKELGDLEKSALCETANIIGCAYINSLQKSLSVKIIPTPPLYTHDLTNSILNSILLEQASYQDKALLIQSEFYNDKTKIDWDFFFLPMFSSLADNL